MLRPPNPLQHSSLDTPLQYRETELSYFCMQFSVCPLVSSGTRLGPSLSCSRRARSFWYGATCPLAHTAVLSKTSHANCHTTLTNRPSRGRRGRFVRVVQQLACEVFARTAVSFMGDVQRACPFAKLEVLPDPLRLGREAAPTCRTAPALYQAASVRSP